MSVLATTSQPDPVKEPNAGGQPLHDISPSQPRPAHQDKWMSSQTSRERNP
jgi:hypothetical protein